MNKFVTPLRYPGGKTAMTSLLSDIRMINGFRHYLFAEPFAGGAGASLSLLYNDETSEIFINDIDPAIHDFWWAVVNHSKPFITMLNKKRVSVAEWYRQRDLYKKNSNKSRLRRGFSTFYLNRCNRSGILNGGVIGGLKQLGKWKINERFNKNELRRRFEYIAKHKSRIHVSCLDAIAFIDKLDLENTFLFIDPPYYVHGNPLYLNNLKKEYHSILANKLKQKSNSAWVLTYNDCSQIRKLYQGWASIRRYSLKYSASSKRFGKEILITPPWLKLPKKQASASIIW